MQYKHKKRFGQNFLNNQSIIDKIISTVNPAEYDHIVEIGPGEAALTLPLAQKVNRLDVIEIDLDLIDFLDKKLSKYSSFKLHNQDALKFNFSKISQPNKKIRVVGNLPYNISSPLIFHLLKYASQIQDMHFMLQQEVVERITAQPNNKAFGRLSVMLQYYCQVEYIYAVAPENFTPRPKVNSAILRLIPYTQLPLQVTDSKNFAMLVKKAFAHKRKTIRNNLKGIFSNQEIESCNISANCRAEQLEIKDFVNLANKISTIET